MSKPKFQLENCSNWYAELYLDRQSKSGWEFFLADNIRGRQMAYEHCSIKLQFGFARNSTGIVFFSWTTEKSPYHLLQQQHLKFVSSASLILIIDTTNPHHNISCGSEDGRHHHPEAREAEWSVDIEIESGIAEIDFVTEMYWNQLFAQLLVAFKSITMKVSIFVQIRSAPLLIDIYIRGRERPRIRDLKCFRVFLKKKKDSPERFSLLFFTRKVSTVTVIFREGG